MAAGTPNSIISAQAIKSPAYTARPVAANSTFSGVSLGNLVPLYAASAAGAGSIMTRLRARPLYASGLTNFTATQAQLFKVDPNGNLIFDDDALIPAQTLSLVNPTVPADFLYSANVKRLLPPGWSWYVGIGVAWGPGVMFSGDIEDL